MEAIDLWQFSVDLPRERQEYQRSCSDFFFLKWDRLWMKWWKHSFVK